MNLIQSMKFEQVAPDQPDFNNPGMERAFNVIPRLNGYQALPKTVVSSANALDSRGLGAHGAKDFADNSFIYAGDSGKLYELQQGSGWVDRSKVGGYNATERWEFANFNNQIIATDFEDPIQVSGFGGTAFADLTTEVRAKHIAIIRNFVVLGNVFNDDTGEGHTPERMRWSGFDDETDYSFSTVTQSDFQDLRGSPGGGGAIRRVIGGQVGIVFQERSIWHMEYVSPPLIFRFDEVDIGIGTISPGSVVRHGHKTFFLSEDGFRQVSAMQPSEAIGEERVDRTILNDLDQTFSDRVTSAVFTDEQIIVWGYPGPGNVGGIPNKLVIFNYGANRWSTGEEAHNILFRGATPFTSVEDLDLIAGSIDTVPGSLDDVTYAGSAFQIASINNVNELALFTGLPRDAEFESGERQHHPGKRTYIGEIRPLVDGGEVTVSVAGRDRQKDTFILGPDVAPNEEGICPFRNDHRYHRYITKVTGLFKDATGLEIFGTPAGNR